MATTIETGFRNRIIQYYEQAGEDYAYWSKGMNMHFGYGNISKLFSREEMLIQMTLKVIDRIRPNGPSCHLADLGCGVGGSMRVVHDHLPLAQLTGVTIVPWQEEQANQTMAKLKCADRVKVLLEDYHSTSLPDESLDGAYAIESSCYSPKPLRQKFFAEASRILKPGARLVIADGFLKKPEHQLCALSRRMYRSICDNWVLAGMLEIDETIQSLEAAGFTNVKIEDASWKVAPSVLHVPFVIVRFLLSKILRGEKLSKQSINNLKGSFMALMLGLQRSNFGYYIVTATKL